MSNESKCPQCGAQLPENAPAGLCPGCLMALNLKTETVFTDDMPAAQPPLPPEQIAPHFPQLEILGCLGRGGMGVVYKARQKTLNRFVALKLLAPERVNDAKFAGRFTREAQALAALNHPNIVTIHDFGQAGGFYFLLMEFVDGVNLRQLLCARKFKPEEALAIVPPLCDALQFAHERGIVHRDIKPENLLLDKNGRVKIADFGIAKMFGAVSGGVAGEAATNESATHSAVGTRGYSAPEQQAAPQHVDSRADIYSLGVVFYEMLTGELPGKNLQPPSTKVQIDVRLDEIVLRALEKKPELRYQQASVMKTQVETVAATPGSSRRRGDEFQSETEKTSERPVAPSPANRGTGALPISSILLRSTLVAFVVGLLVFTLAATVTSILPRTYVATARVKLVSGPTQSFDPYALQNEFARLESPEFLKLVGEKAKLRQVWKDSLVGDDAAQDGQIAGRLRGAMQLRPIRNTDLIEISFHAESPANVADIANAIAATYVGQTHAILVEQARTPNVPVRPNPELNLFIGLLAGGVIGLFAGGITALILWSRRGRFEPSSPVIQEARFSRTAILGACWVLFFALTSGPVVYRAATWRQIEHSGPSTFMLFWWVPWFLGLLAPVGTTIMGWVAVSQIRRSAGKLRGLRLALFDGLLFPLLLVDNIIFWVCLSAMNFHFHSYEFRQHPEFIFYWVLTLSFIGLLDLFIVRAVWRAVKPGVASSLDIPITAVEAWLALMDDGDYAQSWESGSPGFRRAVTKGDWMEALEKVRRPLGKVISRKLVSTKYSLLGNRFEVKFDSSFDGLKSTAETLVFTRQWDGAWKPAGHVIGHLARQNKLLRLKKFFLFTLPATVVVALIVRAYFLQPFYVAGGGVEPELPVGSRILVWKFHPHFAPGDIIAHRHDYQVWVSRVVSADDSGVTVNRNGWSDEAVPNATVLGKVVSIYWRGSNHASPGVTSELNFGPVTNGLQAAVELKTTNGVSVLGGPIEVRFHIRNASATNIYLAGGSWRQDDSSSITIQDEQGRTIPVRHVWYSGLTPIQRNLLGPGDNASFRSTSLGFLPEDADEKMVTSPIGNYVKVKPGKYSVRYRLRFPDVTQGNGPMPYDWQGELETGTVVLEAGSQR